VRQPDLAVDVGEGDLEAEAVVDVGDQATGDFEVVEEVALGLDHDAVLFIGPDGSDEVADDFFGGVACGGVGVAGVIEDDGGAAVEQDAAGVGEGAELEDAGGGDELVAAVVGVLAFGVIAGAFGFGFGDFLVDAVALFFWLVGGGGGVLAGDDAVDADGVDGEAFGVGDGGLFGDAGGVGVELLGVDVVGVVLLRGFVGFLIAFEVEDELPGFRERLFVGACGYGCRGLLRSCGCGEQAESERQKSVAHGLDSNRAVEACGGGRL
jgi:hypothetical protein